MAAKASDDPHQRSPLGALQRHGRHEHAGWNDRGPQDLLGCERHERPGARGRRNARRRQSRGHGAPPGQHRPCGIRQRHQLQQRQHHESGRQQPEPPGAVAPHVRGADAKTSDEYQSETRQRQQLLADGALPAAQEQGQDEGDRTQGKKCTRGAARVSVRAVPHPGQGLIGLPESLLLNSMSGVATPRAITPHFRYSVPAVPVAAVVWTGARTPRSVAATPHGGVAGTV